MLYEYFATIFQVFNTETSTISWIYTSTCRYTHMDISDLAEPSQMVEHPAILTSDAKPG